jgi:hypothetical protein
VKTISLKKVSAVAVASLGFGLMSVVPAQAAGEQLPASQVTALTAAVITAAPTQNALVEVKMGMTLAALTAASGNNADIATFKAALTSYPTGGSSAVTSQLAASYTTTAAATPIVVTGGTTPTIAAVANTSTITATLATENDTAWSAQTKTNIAGFKFTPTKSGTYVMTVWRDFDVDDVVDPTEVQQTVSITVAAASGYSASLSTILMGTGATVATTTTDLLPVSSLKTAGNGQAANIRVAIKDSTGTAYTGQTVTATVSGPGLIMCVSQAAANTAEANATGSVRSVSVADTTGFVSCRLDPDGTAGTGTVTISVTDQTSLATTTLGSKSVTFYGSVAKIVATANYTVLKAAGGVTGGSVATSAAGDFQDLANRVLATDVPAVIVKATDSAGNVVGGLTIKGVSSDTTVANSWSGAGADDTNGCKEDVLSATNVYSSGGTGFYNCALSTPSTAASGKTATITFRILDPSDVTGVAYLTSVVTITTGGTTPGTETITFDKTSYAPGEAMTVIRTCKDTSGNPCADGTAAPAITFSKAVGGTAPAASTYTAGKKSSTSSTGVVSVFAPVIGGAFSANATSGNAAGSAVTASSSVADANAGLLTQIDALNAKIVALNALIAKIMKKLGVK